MLLFDHTNYKSIEPHDAIEKIFPDLYVVHGSFRMWPGTRINRNMIILRQNEELTLIGTIRLSPQDESDESELEGLGTIKHVIRLGYYHGTDDQYYVDRYCAGFWCQPGL